MKLETIALCSGAVALIVACGGNGRDGKGQSNVTPSAVQVVRASEKTVRDEPAPAEPVQQEAPQAVELVENTVGQPVEGPGGEMIPGLAIPSSELKKVDSDTTPTDRGGLFKMAKKARDDGLIAEALAYIDVLLLMEPDDVEFLEFRGVLQLRQGLVEDAKVDLGRCCKLGRGTCCRWMERP